MAPNSSCDDEKKIRRLRKKLRQIENLEFCNRILNEEETFKVSLKGSIRKELNELLKILEQEKQVESDTEDGFTIVKADNIGETEEEMKRRSSENDPISHEIKAKRPCSDIVPQRIPDPASNPSDVVDSGIVEDISKVETTESSADNAGVSDKLPSSPAPEAGCSYSSRNVVTSTTTTTTSQEQAARRRRDKRCKALVKSRWNVIECDGHEDLILDCDIREDIIVTASRDTTVKVWSAVTGELVQSMRGHSGAVTGVRVLDTAGAGARVVSASSDCSVRVWSVEAGQCEASLYTYNTVTRLELLPDIPASVTTTDGGKIELYSLAGAGCLVSQQCHDVAVSALSLGTSTSAAGVRSLATADRAGTVKVWQLARAEDSDQLTLRCVFASEVAEAVRRRPVLSLCHPDGGSNIFYGDSGASIKWLDWRAAAWRRIPNHAHNIGLTDSVAGAGHLLAASCYDLDTGRGGVNLLTLDPEPRYLVTLADGDTGRVLSLGLRECAATGAVTLVTGGRGLKIWRQAEAGAGGVPGRVVSLAAASSGSEEEDTSEDEADTSLGEDEVFNRTLMAGKTSGFCNCSIM